MKQRARKPEKLTHSKEKSKYDAETKDCQLNSLCEQKLYNICCESMNQQTPSDPTCATMNNSTNETTNNINVPSSYTGFQAVSSFVTADLVQKTILSAEAKAFVRVRSNVELVCGRLRSKRRPFT